MKNISAIEKIIKELSFRDYRSANPIGKDGMLKRKFRPYSLSIGTNEAREIRNKYLHDEITEEEYKAWCLRYNLTHKEASYEK